MVQVAPIAEPTALMAPKDMSVARSCQHLVDKLRRRVHEIENSSSRKTIFKPFLFLLVLHSEHLGIYLPLCLVDHDRSAIKVCTGHES